MFAGIAGLRGDDEVTGLVSKEGEVCAQARFSERLQLSIHNTDGVIGEKVVPESARSRCRSA